MIITNELKNRIIKEVKLLKDVDDSVGIKMDSNKGLFIQVVDYGEGKEYLIELNNVDENDVYEPCKEYNAFSDFGNMEELIKTIVLYVE